MLNTLPLGSDPDRSPVFVVGCGRSGTTLLRLILNGHPQMAVFGESAAFSRCARYGPLDRPRSLARFLADWSTVCGRDSPYPDMMESRELRARLRSAKSYVETLTAVMEEFARLERKPRWGEKTPAHVLRWPLILSAYPNARIVHITRDPRAVVGSSRSLPGSIPNELDHAYATARYWVLCERTIERARAAAPQNVILISYEELITGPTATVARLCEFLDLPFVSAMLDTARTAERYAPRDRPGGAIDAHQRALLKPINDGSLEKWRQDMSEECLAVVEGVTKHWLLKRGHRPELETRSGSAFSPLPVAIRWFGDRGRAILARRAMNAFWRARNLVWQ